MLCYSFPNSCVLWRCFEIWFSMIGFLPCHSFYLRGFWIFSFPQSPTRHLLLAESNIINFFFLVFLNWTWWWWRCWWYWEDRMSKDSACLKPLKVFNLSSQHTTHCNVILKLYQASELKMSGYWRLESSEFPKAHFSVQVHLCFTGGCFCWVSPYFVLFSGSSEILWQCNTASMDLIGFCSIVVQLLSFSPVCSLVCTIAWPDILNWVHLGFSSTLAVCCIAWLYVFHWMYFTGCIWAFLQYGVRPYPTRCISLDVFSLDVFGLFSSMVLVRHCLTGRRGPLMPRAHLLPQFKPSSKASSSSSSSTWSLDPSQPLAGDSLLDCWAAWFVNENLVIYSAADNSLCGPQYMTFVTYTHYIV